MKKTIFTLIVFFLLVHGGYASVFLMAESGATKLGSGDPTPVALFQQLIVYTDGSEEKAQVVFTDNAEFDTGGSGGWTLTCDGSGNAMTYASGEGTDEWIYTLASRVENGETCTIAYTQPTDGINRVSNDVDMASFGAVSTLNSSTYNGAVVEIVESHTLSQTGAGADFSESDFNNGNNWSLSVAADGDIGPGDEVVLIGTFSNTHLTVPTWFEAQATAPLIIDGISGGDYNAFTDTGSAAVLSGTVIEVPSSDYVYIQDIKFTNKSQIYGYETSYNPAGAQISYARGWITLDIEETSKVVAPRVLRCRFESDGKGGPAIALGFITDGLFEDNDFTGDTSNATDDEFIEFRAGGSRNIVNNNDIVNSFHIIYGGLSGNANINSQIDGPPLSPYARDPDKHFSGLVLSNNNGDGWTEEGISFDDASGSSRSEIQHPVYEYDIISSMTDGGGAGPWYIYLDNTGGEWTPLTTDRYSGLRMANVNNASSGARYGNETLIVGQYQNRIEVADATEYAKFSTGDAIIIGWIQKNAWIYHNKVHQTSGAYMGWGHIWIEGWCRNFLVEHNYIQDRGWGENYSSAILNQSIYDTFYSPLGVTDAPTHLPNTGHRIRNNRTESIDVFAWSPFLSAPLSYWTYSYNISVVDNIFWETDQSENGLNINKHYAYYSGNIKAVGDSDDYDTGERGTAGAADVAVGSGGGGLQGSDETTGTPAEVYALTHMPPGIRSIAVSGGTTLTITFTKNVDGCNAGSGDCGFDYYKNGSPQSISRSSGSDGTTTRVFTLGSTTVGATSADLYFDGHSDDGGTSDIEAATGGANMRKFTLVPFDLLTEY